MALAMDAAPVYQFPPDLRVMKYQWVVYQLRAPEFQLGTSSACVIYVTRSGFAPATRASVSD